MPRFGARLVLIIHGCGWGVWMIVKGEGRSRIGNTIYSSLYQSASLAWLVLLAALLGCHLPDPIKVRTEVVTNGVPNKESSPFVQMPLESRGACATRVAIIDIDGLLVNENQTGLMSAGTNPVSEFRARLDYVACHPQIRAVVLRINSPGGGVTASDIMLCELKKFKATTGLPVVACMMDVGTGGAYYLATGADQIYAHPTSVMGGIGVILNLYEMELALNQFNIVGVPIKAGKNIDMGSPIRALPKESRALMQKMADEYQKRFHVVIRENRSIPIKGDEPYLDGRIFTSQQAVDDGLIDHIGYLPDAIEAACGLSGCPGSTAVMIHRCRDRAESAYAITPNTPASAEILPLDIPGLNRAKLPLFLYIWQPNPSLEK